MKPYTFPTRVELYALEQRARRDRTRAQLQLMRLAIASAKSFVERIFSTRGPSAHEVHRQVARHA